MKQHTLNPDCWSISHREILLRFALQRISDYGTAEDLVQDTFVSAWHARGQFRGDCSERTWLVGILRNKIIDHYRRKARRPSILAGDIEKDHEKSDFEAAWMDRQPDLCDAHQPAVIVDRNEFMDNLEKAVELLPGKMGHAFRLREIEGLSTEEITKKLNITKSNLWVLIHRAKQALGESMSEQWAEVGSFADQMAA